MVTKILAWTTVSTALLFVLLLMLPVFNWDWLVEQFDEEGVRGWFKWLTITLGWLSVLQAVSLLVWASLKSES
jgi:hypothetical protein